MSLSQAMAKHPKAFNRLYISMVRAGETGGNLEEVLERVAVQLEKDDNLRRTVRSAMVYPTLIGVFAVGTLLGMVLFIIPIFADMFSDLGGELPSMTQLMIDVSDALRTYWYLLLATPIAASLGFRKWKRTDRGRRAWDAFKLRLPMRIGDIVRKIAVARFARTGDPNGPGLPDWPRYAADDRRVLVIDDPIRIDLDPDEAARKLWAQVSPSAT